MAKMSTARSIPGALLAIAVLAAPAEAEVPGLSCTGSDPDWQLVLDAGTQTAIFDFANREVAFDIPQQNQAAGRDWPLAVTLVSRDDTAILILRPLACGRASHMIDILTQRATTPIPLTGYCEVAE